jgi:ABC-type glycerol-3-phosphate transport system substrate-binding protein
MQEMGQQGVVNSDLNTLGYRESFTVLLDGSAAMMPMGTWFRDQILEFTEDPNNFPFDYFNLPPFDGGQGHPRSIMGLNTGYVVNADTPNKELAYDFLRLMVSRQFQDGFVAAGRISTNTAAMQASSDPYVRAVAETLNSTPVLIAPPDTGYNLEMARALYEAIAKAFEGIDPRTALDEAEQKVQFLR